MKTIPSALIALLAVGCAASAPQGAGEAAPTPAAKPRPTRPGPPPARWRQRIASPQLTEQAFTELVAEEIRRVLQGAKVSVEGALKLRMSAPRTAQLGLYNVWQSCRDTPRYREAAVRHYLDAIQHHLANIDEAGGAPDRTRVVPLIKDASYLADIKVRTAGRFKPLAEHLAGDIWIVYALDQPKGMKILTADQAKPLARTPAELRGLAVTNLRRILKGVQSRGDGTVIMLTAGGSYEASLLLLDELWSKQARVVDGDVVASVPNRDVLLFTGSRSAAGIAKICEMMARAGERQYAISRTLLVRRAGRWQVLRTCAAQAQ
jgi:uncharacterized protein YtpQ (UPF0354 family)